MSEFYNPTRPSHFINGALVRKRRVYAPHGLRPARRVGGTMGMNQGPAYFTRSRSSPVRRPRSYSRSPSFPGFLKEEDPTQNHHPGHLLGVLVLGPALDQDLLLTPKVDQDPPPMVDPSQGMKPTFLYGRDSLHKSLGIRKIF